MAVLADLAAARGRAVDQASLPWQPTNAPKLHKLAGVAAFAPLPSQVADARHVMVREGGVPVHRFVNLVRCLDHSTGVTALLHAATSGDDKKSTPTRLTVWGAAAADPPPHVHSAARTSVPGSLLVDLQARPRRLWLVTQASDGSGGDAAMAEITRVQRPFGTAMAAEAWINGLGLPKASAKPAEALAIGWWGVRDADGWGQVGLVPPSRAAASTQAARDVAGVSALP